MAALAVCAVLLAMPDAARADAASIVNALRMEGCARVPATGTPARRDSALDAAARELASGASLADALARAAYPVASSKAFEVRGSGSDAAIQSVLEPRYCEGVNDPGLTELGVHQSGDDTWIVMASRTEDPSVVLRDPAAVARRVLELVNEARGEARRCGRKRFQPAPPLAMAESLTTAASLHSLDMAGRGTLGHDGSDGSSPGDRITRAGYLWRASAENVAAGQRDAVGAVEAWLDSPGHCASLMNASFTQTGIAFALAPGQNPAVYWTQVFASPR